MSKREVYYCGSENHKNKQDENSETRMRKIDRCDIVYITVDHKNIINLNIKAVNIIVFRVIVLYF